jgi:hypothetical protein
MHAYAAAWRAKAPADAAKLFSADAFYTSDPFRPGLHGREQIAAYWTEATGGQEDLSLHVGPPSVGRDRVAAEWWASFRRGGEEVTLAACLLLRFDADGLCCELREYWRQATALQEPPPAWLT